MTIDERFSSYWLFAYRPTARLAWALRMAGWSRMPDNELMWQASHPRPMEQDVEEVLCRITASYGNEM